MYNEIWKEEYTKDFKNRYQGILTDEIIEQSIAYHIGLIEKHLYASTVKNKLPKNKNGEIALYGHVHEESDFWIKIHLPNSGMIIELMKKDLAEFTPPIPSVEEIRNVIFEFNNCDRDLQEKSQKQLAMELILAEKLAKTLHAYLKKGNKNE